MRLQKGEDLRVLFTGSGRRVELIEIFRREGFKVFAADSDPTAPSLYYADKGFIIPKVLQTPDKYLEELKNISINNNINIIIPLIDYELKLLSEKKAEFSNDYNINILISNPEYVKIARNKYETYQFFKQIGLSAPFTSLLGTNLTYDKSLFPVILKPIEGSSGKGIIKCDSLEELNFYMSKYKDYILQKYVRGEEITIDILGDGDGHLISSVQRKRLKIRGGEVERGVTVAYKELFKDAEIFTSYFRPYGVVNIQCFYDLNTKERFYTEINPRFGGGYPLSYNAGANFPRYIKYLLIDKNRLYSIVNPNYKIGLLMSRFDNAIYKKIDDLIK